MYAYVGVGSNQGNRAAHLRAGIAALGAVMVVTQHAAVYATAAMYVTDQPPFLNSVVGGVTALPPLTLLQALKAIEAEQGRDLSPAAQRYGPRPLDLDVLLLYEGDNPFAPDAQPMILETPDLTIPHPKMAERAFVLVPLCDIAAELIHPTLQRTIAALAAAVGDQEITRVDVK
jgi:2-amino-4-hydroxy-6-hydroxymethyldihydropteridine diphosphokinase